MNSLRRLVGPRLIREATANPNRPCGGTQASCLAADGVDRCLQSIGMKGEGLQCHTAELASGAGAR
jgi:hypothetical protein